MRYLVVFTGLLSLACGAGEIDAPPEACQPVGKSCVGTVLSSCDRAGKLTTIEDCAAKGQICLTDAEGATAECGTMGGNAGACVESSSVCVGNVVMKCKGGQLQKETDCDALGFPANCVPMAETSASCVGMD